MHRNLRSILSWSTVAWLSFAGCYAYEDAEKATSELPAPTQVGEEVAARFPSPAITVAGDTGATLVWRQELRADGATYIAPHFSAFSLPEGAHLIVRNADGTRARTYTGNGKDVPGSEGFWAMHMPGDSAVVELHSRVDLPAGAVVIDRFARGTEAYKSMFPGAGDDLGAEAICGADESNWAQCFQSSEPTAYDRSRAVARLMINGTSACTGWLVGSEGHLMTNQHCIGTSSSAANTDYEFMAEGTCATECKTFGGCPGVVEADTGTLVQVNSGLDYALVLLPTNLSSKYGFFQMRVDGPELGERIYIPQHAAAWGKRIAFKDGNQDAVISTLDAPGCTGPGKDVGYFADTQGGSSGSPVVAYDDHLVVALHHCANCPNRGVPVQPIIEHLGNNLPADAVAGGCEPRAHADAGPDRTICLGEATTLGTPARADTDYAWSPGNETGAQITVAPTSTTTYTLTATTECGSRSDTVTVFVDDGSSPGLDERFDGPLAGWSTSGLWHQVSDSSCASPGYSSPLGAMYYGLDSTCTYNTGAATSGNLISPLVHGIHAASVLRFDYFRRVESFSGSYDRTKVFVSANGGVTWTEVWSRDSSHPSENAWTASGDISLAAFAGTSIQVRFHFDSVDGVSNGFTGWLIDNVEVTGESLCGGGGDDDDTAPQVTITAPADGTSVREGSAIAFAGSASDAEDGDLTGILRWTSDLDGVLGTGGAVSATLGRGTHTITASATDSGGLTSTATITVEVRRGNGKI